MRNFLLLVLLCLPPLLLVGQDKAGVMYDKYVILSGKAIKGGSVQDTMHLGGLSALEYVDSNVSKKPSQWILVSDKNRDDRKSHSFTAASFVDLSKISLSKPKPFFNLEDIESIRYNTTLKKYFYVTENDTGSSVGYIGDDSTGHKLFTEPLADGRITNNRGIESLTFGPDNALWIAYESGSSTSCDEQTYTYFYRVPFDSNGATIEDKYDSKKKEEYLYDFDRCSCINNTPFSGKYGNGISEILTYDTDHLLVLERCYNGFKNTVSLYLANINSRNKTISKGRPVFDFNCLANFPDSIRFSSDNLEGMTWGPEKDGKRQLYLISDDNFNTSGDHPQSTQLIVLSVESEEVNKKMSADADGVRSEGDDQSTKECDDRLLDAQSKKQNAGQSYNDSTKPAQPSQGCICKLLHCICRPKPPKDQTIRLIFSDDGKLISKMPAVVKTNDAINIVVEAEQPEPTQMPLGGRFKKAIDKWTPQPDKSVDLVLSAIGFSNNNDVATILTNQFREYQSSINGSALYTVKLEDTSVDLTWDGTKFLGNATVPAPKNSKDTIVLSLKQKNLDNDFTKAVFMKHRGDYKDWAAYQPKFNKLYPDFDKHITEIAQLDLERKLLKQAKEDCRCQSFDDKIANISCQLDGKLAAIQEAQAQLGIIANTVITDNQCWLRSWLWYSGGDPLLNPFGKVSPAAENSRIERDLAANEARMQLYQDLSKQCCTPGITEMLDSLKGPMVQAAQAIVDLKKQKENSSAREQAYASWKKDQAQTQQLLNRSMLFVSYNKTIRWMSHYNAQDNYARMNPSESLPERVYEHDQVHGLVQNLTASQKVSAKEYVKTIPLRTELDIQTDPLSDALDSALGNKGISALAAFLNKLKIGTVQRPSGDTEAMMLSPEKDPTCNPDACLEKLYTILPLIEWLHEQTEPPIVDLQAAYNAFRPNNLASDYHAQDVLVGESQDAAGTNQIKYELYEAGKDKPVAKGSYQTYATIKWWPFVSINYVLGSRAVSIFDNATGQFRTDTDIDNFEAIAGAKWYIKASNITRTHKRTKFIRDALDNSYNKERGNQVWSKTFLFLGLGVSHNFLKNYGFGVGYDIVPGFSIQGGVNVFFQKSYELNNGQIRYEYDIPAVRGFFGIAIDPNVVTKLIRLF